MSPTNVGSRPSKTGVQPSTSEGENESPVQNQRSRLGAAYDAVRDHWEKNLPVSQAPARTGPTPPQPEPQRKLRVPPGYGSSKAYRSHFLTRLNRILASQGLSATDLVNARIRRLSPSKIQESFDAFRVSVVKHADRLMALANTFDYGGTGKFSYAMASNGELLAAKSLRTEEKSGAYTQAVSAAALTHEVSMLCRYFDPTVASFEYGNNGKHVIVMPLGLSDLIRLEPSLQNKRDTLARATVLQVAIQLQQLHNDGLSHNDIKPANIVVFKGGRIRLIDMGEVQPPDIISFAATPIFAAPETSDPTKTLTSKVDIWSLGLTIALVRYPPARGLLSISPDPLGFMISLEHLYAGIERARCDPSTFSSPATDEETTNWEAYFRSFNISDPELAQLVLNKMLVPADQRVDTDSLVALAETLGGGDSTALGEACQQIDDSRFRRALRLAFMLRLADEAGIDLLAPL